MFLVNKIFKGLKTQENYLNNIIWRSKSIQQNYIYVYTYILILNVIDVILSSNDCPIESVSFKPANILYMNVSCGKLSAKNV